MSQDHFLNLQPGTVVNGRYEIVKRLGTGSMGMVYACRHRELAGHLVAMKVLFAEVARDSVTAARFRNEIVASYGVSHPNVVRAYEYFRDGDLIAFTMEYVGGGDLADRINADKRLTIEEIIRMLSQMCSGVQAIHDAGIVHRDLKPENILLTPQGDVKITDFGIARMQVGPKLTEHGGVVGTIDYVSPEYLERGQVDFRSDIYALGVLAYEMITGQAPYRGQSVIETMTMRLRSDPELPYKLRPDCPTDLSNVVMRAMHRDTEKRYQSAAEMYNDLIKLSSTGVGRVAPPPPPPMSARALESKALWGDSAESADTASTLANEPITEEPVANSAGVVGTVLIDSTSLRKESPAGVDLDYDYDTHEQLDSVLGSDGEAIRESYRTSSNSNISMSSGKLSPERVRELSKYVRPEEEESFLGTFLWMMLMIFLGFLAFVYFMSKFNPNFLEDLRERVFSSSEASVPNQGS